MKNLLKNNYRVEQIPNAHTYEWLLKKHYAKRIPSISYAFGLYKESKLVGVCTFGSPPSRALCVGICGEKYAPIVLELNRFVIEQIDKNQASYFIGICLRLLKKPTIVVSYADTSKNHHGYIYQATNWIYTGLSAKRTERFDAKNPQKHSKTVTQAVGVDYQSLSIRERPQKHRYIYFVGDKKFKKEMLKTLKYEVQPYPKGINSRYDASYVPSFNGKLL